MSGYFNESDTEREEREDNSGAGLRKQLEAALEREKRYLAQLEGDRTKTATELLKDKGLDPGLIALVNKGEDPVEWVERNSALLGAKTTTQPEETVIDQPEVTMASDDDPALVAEREALAAMQDAQATGSPSATVTNDLIEQMNKVTTEDELLALFKANGGTAG